MERMRKAILALVAEDISMIGEMTRWTEDVVAAWNEEVAPKGMRIDPDTHRSK